VRELRGAALMAVVAIGLSLVTANLLARPHVLALPIAAAWSAGLLAARDRNRAPPLGFAALMVAWVNLHGGFIFGLALIAPFALEAAASASRGSRLATLRAWTMFGLAACAAALINPYGVGALLFPFRLVGVENLSFISEWAPQDFGRLEPMELGLLALLGFALSRPVAVPPVRVALVTVLLAMALGHARHAQLLGLLAPMLLARPIAEAIGAEHPNERAGEVARMALAASLAAALGLSALRIAAPVERVDGPTAPIAALAAAPAELRAKPVLNAYGFGGYLISAGVKPFVDGRADMYGGAMLGLARKIAAGDPATVEETLRRYRIAWTMFAPGDGAVATLDREPGFRRLYADAFAVVHVREDAPPRAAE
jgi:hypothetical protein